MTPSKDQIKGAIEILRAVADAIKELGSVPSGHLYARLMGHMNLQSYQQIIDTLVKAQLVKSDNHMLTWIGPK